MIAVSGATIHQWPGYEEESHGLLDNNEEGSDNSEEEGDTTTEQDPDPWKISPEQRGWYLSLFLRLQPDIHGFIEGVCGFSCRFTKKLPCFDVGSVLLRYFSFFSPGKFAFLLLFNLAFLFQARMQGYFSKILNCLYRIWERYGTLILGNCCDSRFIFTRIINL